MEKVLSILAGGLLLLLHHPTSTGAANIRTTEASSSTTPVERLHNWMWTYEFTPAIIARPQNERELSQIVRDTKKYPSPLRALGSMHSPSECVVNEGGAVVNMTAFKSIKGLTKDSRGRLVVTAQAGVTLLELHTWLANHDRQIPFIPTIGDATIGSLAVSVSKDSNVGDMSLTGSFYKAVTGLTYVNHEGKVVPLSDTKTPTELAAFKCSDGILGIVTEVTVVTVPAQLLTARLQVIPTADVLLAFENGTWVVDEDHAITLLVKHDYTMAARMTRAPEGTNITNEKVLEIANRVVRDSLRLGEAQWLTLDAKGASLGPVVFTEYKQNVSTHFGPVALGSKRGDGTWYEFPMENFQTVMKDYLTFLKDFKDANGGYEPAGGAAVFFVKRIPDKPFGWFSEKGAGFDKPGLSFTLDTTTDNPEHPLWRPFLEQNNAFAVEHGGRLSLTQTRFVTRADFLSAPGQQPIPEAPNARFTTPFFKQYVA